MSKKLILYTILFISILLGLYRIYPFFDVNIAFGYDPGLYRLMFMDYINNLPNINFTNLSGRDKSAYPPFLGFLGNILHIVGFKVDDLLSFGLGFFSMIISIFIYINLKKYSKITGIIGIILFMISIIQYQSFAMNYYKQIIGIIFFLTIFYLLEKRRYILSIPLIISVFTIHRPSGLFFLIVFVFHKIFNFIKYKKQKNNIEYKDILVVFLAGIIALLMYFPLFQELILNLIKPLITTIASSGKSGSFFSLGEFFKYNYLFIFISLYGFYYKVKNKDFDYIFIGYLVGVLWIILKLFFYNRFLIFFDIFVILLTAYSFRLIYKNYKNVFYYLFVIFIIIQSYSYLNYVNLHNKAEITQIELENIKKINKMLPQKSYIIVNSRSRSPWLAGYTLRKIIAPGLFEYDKFGLEGWKKWWFGDGKVKCDLLKMYYSNIDELYWWKTKFRLGNKWYNENLKGGYCFKKTNIGGKDFNLYKIELNEK